MKDALKQLSAEINSLIAGDSFPEQIQPPFLRDAVRDYPMRGGKRLRPAIAVWSCGLFGGDVRRAYPAAAAIEIFHNWTLVHDDIIDDDDVRRGRPTTHCSLAAHAEKNHNCDSAGFGRNFAILAGDLQQAWAADMLLKSVDRGVSPELTLALARRLYEQAAREVISGEALDVEQSVRELKTISSAEVERMLCLKTSSLLNFAAKAGAAIALDDPDFARPEIAAIGEFAAHAGIAFQLRDDWLGIFGDFETFGKGIGSDLSARKATVLLLKTLELLPEKQAEELYQMLGREHYTGEELEKVRSFMRDSGAERFVVERAARLTADAREILANCPDNSFRVLLDQLLAFLVERDL
jgi:geranylgeranyl diphosphate synthase type I